MNCFRKIYRLEYRLFPETIRFRGAINTGRKLCQKLSERRSASESNSKNVHNFFVNIFSVNSTLYNYLIKNTDTKLRQGIRNNFEPKFGVSL